MLGGVGLLHGGSTSTPMSRVLPDNGRFDLAAGPSWLLMNQSTEEMPRGGLPGVWAAGVFVQGSGRAKGRPGGDQ